MNFILKNVFIVSTKLLKIVLYSLAQPGLLAKCPSTTEGPSSLTQECNSPVFSKHRDSAGIVRLYFRYFFMNVVFPLMEILKTLSISELR